MKYKYTAITLFSAGLLDLYTALLVKISADHEQPHLHTATFVGSRGQSIISVIQPVVGCLRRMLELLISCRDTEFRDLSLVTPLLRVHTLLSVVPQPSMYHRQAENTRLDIVQCLLNFSQPNVDLTKNNMGRSLWSQMLSELVSYTGSVPLAHLPGLGLLSELLPLPLPLPSLQPLEESEERAVTTWRKLWSAHLHPVSPQLSSLLALIAAHSCPALTSLLHRVAEQLAGLSPPSALLVVTGLLDSLQQSEESGSVVVERQHQFLAWCTAQPAIKAVVVERMREPAWLHSTLLSCLQAGLAAGPPTATSCVQTAANLCDPAVTLRAAGPGGAALQDSLPVREGLTGLLNLLLDHLGSEPAVPATESGCWASQAAAVSSLVLVAEQDYSLAVLRCCLATPATTRPLHFFLRRLAVSFGPAMHPDLLACLTATPALLEALVAAQPALLASCLGWTAQEDGPAEAAERRRTHPLVVLSNRMKETEAEDHQIAEAQVMKCSVS